MRIHLDCIPCFFKQALFTCRIVTNDEPRIRDILNQIGQLLPQIGLDSSPPEIAAKLYGLIAENTRVSDPFKKLKEKSIQSALDFYPKLKDIVEGSSDPLLTAARVAIAGNIIDFGASQDFVIAESVKDVLEKELAINHYNSFCDRLSKAKRIVYLADNAGETVFDRILVEQIAKPILYAVREKPVINDATLSDAAASGLDGIATIISSGCAAPGTILSRCTEEFIRTFNQADLIISKGQGNYETLSREERPIFYLLRAKCPVVAKDLGVEVGDIVLKYALTH